jgi:GNAT superfamily N-acetyltransferase
MTVRGKLTVDHLKTTIRKALADDAAVAWQIRNAAINSECKGHYPAELLAIWSDGPATEEFAQFVAEHVFVATIDETVVGTGMIDCSTGRVDAIFVRPDMLRRGIGRQIVSFLEGVARTAGLTELTLDSTLNAAAFYRSCGFVGDTAAKYRSPRGVTLDCIPMTKRLGPRKEMGCQQC